MQSGKPFSIETHVVAVGDLRLAQRYRVARTAWQVALVSFASTAATLWLLGALGLPVFHLAFWWAFCLGGLIVASLGMLQQWRMEKRLSLLPSTCLVILSDWETASRRVVACLWSTVLASIFSGLLVKNVFIPGMNYLCLMGVVGGVLSLCLNRGFASLDAKQQLLEQHTLWLLVRWKVATRRIGEFVAVVVAQQRGDELPPHCPIRLITMLRVDSAKLLDERMSAKEALACGERIASYLALPLLNEIDASAPTAKMKCKASN